MTGRTQSIDARSFKAGATATEVLAQRLMSSIATSAALRVASAGSTASRGSGMLDGCASKDHTKTRILQTMISGTPFFLGIRAKRRILVMLMRCF